jgi:hypothetical protein
MLTSILTGALGIRLNAAESIGRPTMAAHGREPDLRLSPSAN